MVRAFLSRINNVRFQLKTPLSTSNLKPLAIPQILEIQPFGTLDANKFFGFSSTFPGIQLSTFALS